MKKLNTLDKILIIVEVQVIAFTVATMIIYTRKEWQFDTLVTCFLGLFGGIEPVVTGGIQIAKYFKNRKREEDPEEPLFETNAIGFRVENGDADDE